VLESRLVIERQIDEAGQAERDRLLAAAAITTAPLGDASALGAGGVRPPRHALLRCNPLAPTTTHPSQKDAH
jgi:hypothetical protein